MPRSSLYRGWYWDKENDRLELYYNNTKVGHFTGTTFVLAAGVGVTVTDTGLTVTAGGATVTAGNLVVTADDARITAGNVRLGAVETFGTTQPTSAVVLKEGTAPSGAITTSSGIYASATVLRKVIADGTLSNVET